MKIVVTGALGHIGSRLIRELPAAFPGSEIVLVDNLATQRYCSLFGLPPGRFQFFEADVLTAELGPLLREASAVVHLAAITDATSSFENKDQVEQVNFEGLKRVAEFCWQNNVPLIFPSTTSVYGPQTAVVDEACSIAELRPQSPYAESKLKAEQFLEAGGANHGLRFVIGRLGTIFGASPGMRFHTAVNKFIWQACFGQPLTVWRTALHQRRPYLDLGDAVRAFRFIMSQDIYDGRVYNVVTLNATVAEIIERIRAYIPDLRVEYVDAAIMNQLSYTVANDRFRARGFNFQGDLTAGIAETIALLKNHHAAPH